MGKKRFGWAHLIVAVLRLYLRKYHGPWPLCRQSRGISRVDTDPAFDFQLLCGRHGRKEPL